MLLVLSDTHCETEPELTPHLREELDRADRVLHAGDFTTESVLDGFEALADEFRGVVGNNDAAAIRDRLPETRIVEWAGLRLVVVHGHEHSTTALGLLARQENADVVIVGHSHRPGIETSEALTVVNPGSHADPRGHRPAYAMMVETGGSIRVQLRTRSGREFESARLQGV